MLDLRTILFSNVISSGTCVIIASFLWMQNHKRFPGLERWLVFACCQSAGAVLLALRGAIPDFLSVVCANVLILCAMLSVYAGAARFFGRRAALPANIAVVIVFTLMHGFFTYVHPSLALRNINISLGVLLFSAQAAVLLLARIPADKRRMARTSGIIFLLFCLISAGRIAIELTLPPERDFTTGDPFNNLTLLLYQMLIVVLVFNLFLMVNRRLIAVQAEEICERSRAEGLLQASLNEKEVLLRELYHRTKNNMQVISSLLTLGASRCGSAEAARILHDMDGRVRSMALVHQKLYQSRNLSVIDLGDYLRELAALIRKVHGAESERVSAIFECESIPVLFDSAVPLGLIVNEIISNSLKHAFPDGRAGEIRVTLRRTDSGSILVYIADNGTGLASARDFPSSGTLGMQIIFGVARHQLGASIEYESKEGLCWRIEFRDDRYAPRVENEG